MKRGLICLLMAALLALSGCGLGRAGSGGEAPEHSQPSGGEPSTASQPPAESAGEAESAASEAEPPASSSAPEPEASRPEPPVSQINPATGGDGGEAGGEENALESHQAGQTYDLIELDPPASNTTGVRQAFPTLTSEGSVIGSGNFEARDGEQLTLTATSSISGGTVEFFLFDPENVQVEHIVFAGEGEVRMIAVYAGTWAYNCTGFFQEGSFSLSATVG